jgi:hypothetical protein
LVGHDAFPTACAQVSFFDLRAHSIPYYRISGEVASKSLILQSKCAAMCLIHIGKYLCGKDFLVDARSTRRTWRVRQAAGRKLSQSALDTASGVSGWWLHDLRRTLATGLQRLGVRLEVTEAVLNHLSGSRAGVVGIYQRHDWAEEKRAALDAWSAHLLAAAEGRLTAVKVLPFSRARSGEILAEGSIRHSRRPGGN